MSAAAEGQGSTTKLTASEPKTATKEEQTPAAALEEDDEFEDFPVEGLPYSENLRAYWRGLIARHHFSDWPAEDQEVPGEGGTNHLWEESWDDDDTSEDFSKQLKSATNLRLLTFDFCSRGRLIWFLERSWKRLKGVRARIDYFMVELWSRRFTAVEPFWGLLQSQKYRSLGIIVQDQKLMDKSTNT